MKIRSLITTLILTLGTVTAAQALFVQTYGVDEGIWQAERDRAYRERGQPGLVEYDRQNARRFYGNAYPSLPELDRQIRIDRGETELDTQERADQVRYNFGRGNGTVPAATVVLPKPVGPVNGSSRGGPVMGAGQGSPVWDNGRAGQGRDDWRAGPGWERERFGGRSGPGSGAHAPLLQLGAQLPVAYSADRFAVNDWHSHRLAAPRRGERWVQVGADYALVNRGGIIMALQRAR